MNKQFLEENINLVYYLSDRIGSKLSTEDRQDLVQDVCVKILSSGIAAKQDSASAYVSNIMKNCILNYMRDGYVDAMGHSDSLDAPASDEDGNKVAKVDLTEGNLDVTIPTILYKNDVRTLINHMSPLLGSIFYKKYYISMTYQDIADELGCSYAKVNSLISRAKREAYSLVNTLPKVAGRFNGMSLREMCLVSLPDEVLFPFKFRYVDGYSLLEIATFTGIGLGEIKQDINAGAWIIQGEYGLDVQRQ